MAVGVLGDREEFRPDQGAVEGEGGEGRICEHGIHPTPIGGHGRGGHAALLGHGWRFVGAALGFGHGGFPKLFAGRGVETQDLAFGLVTAGEKDAVAPSHRRAESRHGHGGRPGDSPGDIRAALHVAGRRGGGLRTDAAAVGTTEAGPVRLVFLRRWQVRRERGGEGGHCGQTEEEMAGAGGLHGRVKPVGERELQTISLKAG